MTRFSPIAASLLLAGSMASHAAAGDYRVFESRIPGAPPHSLPMSASEIADARLREILAAKLAETLDFNTYEDEDLERLLRLADLSHDPGAVAEKPLAVSEDTFNPDGEKIANAKDTGAHGDLSPDQLQAMAFLIATMSNPEMMAMIQAGFSHGHQSYGPGKGQAEGGGPDADASILLRGWNVALRADGTTKLYQDDNPGSEITLEPGLVIGALGAVTDIRQIGQEVLVNFENGDSLSGRVEVAFSGIPPLPPLSRPNEQAEELILSSPARPLPRLSTSSN